MRRLEIAADDFDGPNGLCFSPDEQRLYVAESGRQFAADPVRHIRVFDVMGDRLRKGRVFHTGEPGFADGFRCDGEGNVWVWARKGEVVSAVVIGGSRNTGCDQLGSILRGKLSGGISPLSGIPFVHTDENPLAKAFQIIITSIIVAALAALISTIFPVRIRRLTHTQA